MAWTDKQKQLAVRACRAAGIGEEQRTDLILRNFEHARHKGDITSTSPKLTNRDFCQFMAIVETYAGGKVLHFTNGYWRQSAADDLASMRRHALKLAAACEEKGLLAANGVGLAGWIEKRVSGGATDRVEELDFTGLLALIVGLVAYARQRGVPILLAKAS
jgi:hypothetical protein